LHTHKTKHQSSSKCKEQTIYPTDLNKIDFKTSTHEKKARERKAYGVAVAETLELSREEWRKEGEGRDSRGWRVESKRPRLERLESGEQTAGVRLESGEKMRNETPKAKASLN
jgi:hypothetical protein